MKKFFKKIAAKCVLAYANRIYKQAIKAAEERYEDEKKMIYVITDPADEKKLMLITRQEFLDLRHKYQIPSKALPLQTLKSSCWYHTKNHSGLDELSYRDQVVRRLAFGRELLTRAKLA